MNANIQDLATRIYSPLFAERETIRQAYDEAIEAVSDNNGAITAIHVLLNSIAVQIEKLNAE
jgi:hypothetical protein